MKSKLGLLSLEVKKIESKVYTVLDLEKLSASALYTGNLPPMGPERGMPSLGDAYLNKSKIYTSEGTVDADSISGYEPAKLQPTPNLTIRDFPNLGFQLHIHEEDKGYTHFKFENGKGPDKYFEINSYDAAMADGGQKAYDVMENLKQLNKLHEKLKWIVDLENGD